MDMVEPVMIAISPVALKGEQSVFDSTVLGGGKQGFSWHDHAPLCQHGADRSEWR